MDSQVLTWSAGTISSSGDTPILASPGANLRLVIAFLILQNESTTADLLLVKEGNTVKMRVLAQNQGDGIAMSIPPRYEWRLPGNTALNLNKAQAVASGFTVGYYVEPA